MSPDFAYFVFPPLSLRDVGHRPWGLVLFCIPAGLVVLYAFHRFFKRPLVLLLPRPVRARLWPHCGQFPLLPLKRLIWVCVLIFLGAVTHVIWDGFTHGEGWAVRDYPQMKVVIIAVAGQEVHWAGLLQYASSLIGLGLLAWGSWRWYQLAPVGCASADSTFLWRAGPAIAVAMIAFGTGVGIVCGLTYASNLPGPFNVREFFSAAFITGVDAFGLALLVFVAAVNMRVGSAAWEASEAGRQPLLRDLGDYSRRQKPGELQSRSCNRS